MSLQRPTLQRRQAGAWILGLLLLAVVSFYAGRAILVPGRAPDRLIVYAFSTQEEVLTQGIFPAFEQQWEARNGQELTIEGVFGPSGTVAGQINLGAPADVALFSNAHQVTWLKIGRRVNEETQPVVIAHTIMAIITRPGNPAGVHEFSDLTSPNLRLIHADPRTSGAGEWALLAEYGSAWMEANDQAAAEAQLQAIWQNVRLMAPSARAALTLFELGAGDALVTYEQDARLAAERGVTLELVVPSVTIIAEHVAVAVDDNVTRWERPLVNDFIGFLTGDAGQAILARYHLRPAVSAGDEFPQVAHPFTVNDLGGWALAYPQMVENLWQNEIEPRLELEPAPGLLDQGGSG